MPESTDNNRISSDIAIIEMDALYTFFKKIAPEFVLLWAKNSLCLLLGLTFWIGHFGSVLKMKSPQGTFLKAFLKNLSQSNKNHRNRRKLLVQSSNL